MSDDRTLLMKEVVRLARAYVHHKGKVVREGAMEAKLRRWTFVEGDDGYLVVHALNESFPQVGRCLLVAKKIGIHHYDPLIERELDGLKQMLVLEMLSDV